MIGAIVLAIITLLVSIGGSLVASQIIPNTPLATPIYYSIIILGIATSVASGLVVFSLFSRLRAEKRVRQEYIPSDVAIQAEKSDKRRHTPIKITLEIDGAPITVEADDLEDAEAALTLAQRFATKIPSHKIKDSASEISASPE